MDLKLSAIASSQQKKVEREEDWRQKRSRQQLLTVNMQQKRASNSCQLETEKSGQQLLIANRK